MTPTLTAGDHVRLDPEGPVYVVFRVTPCAAYLRSRELRTVTLPDGRTFEAHSTTILAVSCRSSLYREGG